MLVEVTNNANAGKPANRLKRDERHVIRSHLAQDPNIVPMDGALLYPDSTHQSPQDAKQELDGR